MNGNHGNTDFDWYQFLAARGRLDEVNFWQPGGGRPLNTLSRFEPFLFKLKKPHYAVAGFGFYAGYSALPAWLAWQSFEQNNGAPTAGEMYERIGRYRAGAEGPVAGLTIGCLMVVQPVFFPRSMWVPQPADWPLNAVQGKTYDLAEGEGKRVWDECQAVAGHLRPAVAVDPPFFPAIDGPRYGEAYLVRPRLGQGTFRVAVTDAYERACAVTGEHSLPVLDAAHIRPYADGGPHDVRNGLSLRTDIHRLFDLGYVTVDADYKFQVSRRLEAEFNNGKAYYALEGREIRVPSDAAKRPHREFLDWHRQVRFAP